MKKNSCVSIALKCPILESAAAAEVTEKGSVKDPDGRVHVLPLCARGSKVL